MNHEPTTPALLHSRSAPSNLSPRPLSTRLPELELIEVLRPHLASASALVSIARPVGYESEEAFSRAFKRSHGLAPSHWRSKRAIAEVGS